MSTADFHFQPLDKIRNIGIIAHVDAGKTTVSEEMLYYSGMTHSIGSIDEGNTILDYLSQERERGITIVSAAATLPWQDHYIHLIDTPGHIDFTAEVERSLRVIDGAVVIFSGMEGVEAQSEKVWHQADSYQIPKVAFINKLDRAGASFSRVANEINEKFEQVSIPLQFPIGQEDEFDAIIDLISLQCYKFLNHNDPDHIQILSIPEELKKSVENARLEMVTSLAEFSEKIAEFYLSDQRVPEELLMSEVRHLTLSNKIIPILCGAAKNRTGIKLLMEAIVDFLPSPLDIKPPIGKTATGQLSITPERNEPFSGLIFKLTASATTDLLYLRTYSGTLPNNTNLINARTGEKVKVKRLLRLFANNYQNLEACGPGDIVAIVGPKNTFTGDTLCAPERIVSLHDIEFPEPVISMAIEHRNAKEKEKLIHALELLSREDPTLTIKENEQTGQRIISGMGELHLEINLNRIEEEFHLAIRAGAPQVSYRETINAPATETFEFNRTIGDKHLSAKVTISISPTDYSLPLFSIKSKLANENLITAAVIDEAKKALSDAIKTGGLQGYPLIYLTATIEHIEIESKETGLDAITPAILQAFDHALRSATTKLLEPIMQIEIITPDNSVGEVTNYLQTRHAIIHKIIEFQGQEKIVCEVPLSAMFGFSKALPKLTGGRGSFNMSPNGYRDTNHS